jgi:hypothetical protein
VYIGQSKKMTGARLEVECGGKKRTGKGVNTNRKEKKTSMRERGREGERMNEGLKRMKREWTGKKSRGQRPARDKNWAEEGKQ